jgi:glycosyltransferase involved in cell wall biosynthesis
MSKKKKKILYISYDGILEPLGNSQVLKYLEHLAEEFEITLLSFEKKNIPMHASALLKMHEHCTNKKILWRPQKYHQGLGAISSLINIFNITFAPFIEMLINKHQIIHIRSYMPGLGMPLLKLFFSFKLIFDIRGFWADEKVDRLGWQESSKKYKFFKALESSLFKRADAVVTLTHESKTYIEKEFAKSPEKINVIRTCVDFNEFNAKKKLQHDFKISKKLRIGYLGSIDTAYDFNQFLRLVKDLDLRNIEIHLKVLSNTTNEVVMAYLKKNQLEHINHEVLFLNRNELSSAINEFDFLGFALKKSFSLIASMPTKIAESLACGTPIICNNFNSDIQEMILENKIGILYDFSEPLNEKKYQEIIDLIKDGSTSEVCVNFSKKYFSLQGGVEKYREIYNHMK